MKRAIEEEYESSDISEGESGSGGDEEPNVEFNKDSIYLTKVTPTSIVNIFLDLSTEKRQFSELNFFIDALRRYNNNINELSILLPLTSQTQTLDENKALCKLLDSTIRPIISNLNSLHIKTSNKIHVNPLDQSSAMLDYTRHDLLQKSTLGQLISASKITVLKISHMVIINEDTVSSICKILSWNYPCNVLKIYYSNINEEHAQRIFKALYHNRYLQVLDLEDDIEFGLQQIELETLLRCNSALKTLNLNNNLIPKELAPSIMKFASCNSSIENLLLYSNSDGMFAPNSLNINFFHNKTLKVLSLSYSEGCQNVVDILTKILSNYHSLEVLDCSYNDINNLDFCKLSRAIINHPSLEVLVCNANKLTDESVNNIADMVNKNKYKLKETYFYANILTKQAIYKIFSKVNPYCYMQYLIDPKKHCVAYKILMDDPNNDIITAQNTNNSILYFGITNKSVAKKFNGVNITVAHC